MTTPRGTKRQTRTEVDTRDTMAALRDQEARLLALYNGVTDQLAAGKIKKPERHKAQILAMRLCGELRTLRLQLIKLQLRADTMPTNEIRVSTESGLTAEDLAGLRLSLERHGIAPGSSLGLALPAPPPRPEDVQ